MAAKRAPRHADFTWVVDQIRDYAIFMLDTEGLVATWNRGAQQLKGYTAEEIIGRHFSCFYSEEDVKAGAPARSLEAARRNGRYEVEAWRIRKDGSRFRAHVVITPLTDAAGELTGFLKITRDLRERDEAREEHRQRQLAETALRERDRFLSMASHELRSPLSALKLYIQTIAEEVQSANVDRLLQKLPTRLERVQRQADRIDTLLNRLMNASAIAAGQLRLHSEELDLAEMVATVADAYSEAARQSGCELTVRNNGAAIGRWSAEHLESAIRDLLDNAVKFGAGKPIAVSVGADRAQAWVSIRDHGAGIAAADRERIFERFQQLPESRNCTGLGLGLWMSREIVSALGGTISVDSQPGEGAIFTIRLPLAAPDSHT